MQRLLIIDDEPAFAKFIQQVAQSCGYDATVTTNHDDFMDALVSREPAVIITDLSMPGMDGIELLRFLATARCKANILIVSGFDRRVVETTGRLGSAMGLRIAGTLAKPLRAADLRLALNKLEETVP